MRVAAAARDGVRVESGRGWKSSIGGHRTAVLATNRGCSCRQMLWTGASHSFYSSISILPHEFLRYSGKRARDEVTEEEEEARWQGGMKEDV